MDDLIPLDTFINTMSTSELNNKVTNWTIIEQTEYIYIHIDHGRKGHPRITRSLNLPFSYFSCEVVNLNKYVVNFSSNVLQRCLLVLTCLLQF